MTYGRLKAAAKLFLIGDNELPDDPEMLTASVEMGFLQIADKATALKLLTTGSPSQLIRQGPGGTYVRMPDLPTSDSDIMDIDNELCPALARYMASHVSREKAAYHTSEAEKIIRGYESKVRVYIEERESEGEYANVE